MFRFPTGRSITGMIFEIFRRDKLLKDNAVMSYYPNFLII